MSFGCERSCSSPRRVSNFNSKVPQGGIYPHIKFERDRLNIVLEIITVHVPEQHGTIKVRSPLMVPMTSSGPRTI